MTTTALQDLAWLAEKLQGVIALGPELKGFQTVLEARDQALKELEIAKAETLALRAEESDLYSSIKSLRSEYDEQRLQLLQALKEERQQAEADVEAYRQTQKAKAQAEVSEITRNKFAVERVINEHRAALKELSNEEDQTRSRIIQARKQLEAIQAEILAIKSKF